MGPELSPYRSFTDKCAAFERLVHGRTEQLSSLASADPALAKLCRQLYALDRTIEQLRWEKAVIVEVADQSFVDSFRSYGAYRAAVNRWFLDDLLKELGDPPDSVASTPISPIADDSSRRLPSYSEYHQPGEEFEPGRYDLWDCLENVFWEVQHRLDGKEDDEEHAYANRLRVALGAWNFLKTFVGFDLRAAIARFSGTREFWLSSSLPPAGSLKRPLVELLHEAVLAHAFGAPSAAMALCRAILETILLRYYCEEVAPKETVNVRKLIEQAENQHPWVSKLNLGSLYNAANDVMHTLEDVKVRRTRAPGEKSIIEPFTTQDLERRVGEFLDAIRQLIEKAPARG